MSAHTSRNYPARYEAALQHYPTGHKYAGCIMPFRPHGPNVAYVCPSNWTSEDSARGGPVDLPPWTEPPTPPPDVKDASTGIVGAGQTVHEPTPEGVNADSPVFFVLFKSGELVGKAPPFDLKSGAPHYPQRITWGRLASFLSFEPKPGKAPPFEGDYTLLPDVAKRQRGGWLPGVYSVNAGHAGLSSAFVSSLLFVLDVDEGSPKDLAVLFGDYETIIHSTYKHTADAGRCRVVFLLKEECTSSADVDEAHVYFEKLLARHGIKAPAKDARCGRLVYLPMHQKGVAPVCITTHGRRLDLAASLSSYRAQRGYQPPKAPRPYREPKTGTGYAQAALRKATEAVAWATSGERHNILVKEAASLSRQELGLDAETIIGALLPAAVQADSETDEREHLRGITWGLKKGGLQ